MEPQTWADKYKALSPAEIRLGVAIQELQPERLGDAMQAHCVLYNIAKKFPLLHRRHTNHAQQLWAFYSDLYDTWKATERLKLNADYAHNSGKSGLRRSDIDAS